MKNPRCERNQFGSSSILLFVLAGFVLLPLGLLTFEVWRYVSARNQLQYICDASTLCATANLLKDQISQSSPNPGALQSDVTSAAKYIFQKNSVLGSPFSVSLAPAQSPCASCIKPDHADISISLLDTKQNQVSFGDPAAKGSRIICQYGYTPLFGRYIGLNTVPITVKSDGGIPLIDLVLCFDVSASMDDATAVTMVKRYWDGQQVAYDFPPDARGTLNDIVKPKQDGSKVNAVGPQNLSCLSTPFTNCPVYFSESATSKMKGLRALVSPGATSEVGCPPGNYNSAQPSSAANLGTGCITDLVTNLDGQAQFGGWTDPATGLQFPNVQTMVEASRGNLNSQSAMQKALVLNGSRPSWLPATAPNPLYQQVFFSQANKVVQPMSTAKVAAAEILRALNKSTDLHCALVSYSDYIGSSPTSTWGQGAGATTYFVDSHWAPGGTCQYPLPLVRLNPNQAAVIGQAPIWALDKWLCPPAYAQAPPGTGGLGGGGTQTIIQLISSLVATGMSDVAAALHEAVGELTNPALTRPDAEKIILLISDGEPDLPGGGGGVNSPAAQAAYTEATAAGQQGIKIFSVDVSTSANPEHQEFLTKVATLSNGLYANGSNPNQLNLVLQNMLTQLVALK